MKHKKLFWLIPVLFLAGCISTATIASYLPVFETAVNGVIALVSPTAAPEAAKIEAALNVVVAAVSNAPGSPTVASALAALASVSTQVETDLGVSTNKDVQLAFGILDLGIGTYEAIVAAHTQSIPAAPAPSGLSTPTGPGILASFVSMDNNPYAEGQAAAAAHKVRPAAKSVGDFKRQYNALVKAGGHPEMAMKLSMAEKIHLK